MTSSVVYAAALCLSLYAAEEPRLEWAFETRGKIYASPILADLDGDGQSEVVVAASRDCRILCLNGAGGLLWDYKILDGHGDGIQATPSVVDYDGDGRREVFFATKGGTIGCLDHRGALRWRTRTHDPVDYSGPVAADIDADGRIEIVAGAESGTLYCLDDAGAIRWRYQGQGEVRGVPAVAWDPAVASMRIYAAFAKGALTCLNCQGETVWSHDEPRPRGERRSSPAVGDIDGDGALEVVAATDDYWVIVRDAFTGAERWRWKGQHRIDQTNHFALADLDGTGRLDILGGDGSGQGGPGNVYRLWNAQPLWIADAGGGVVQGPAVGDVNGDGRLDVLACSRSKRLMCWSASGSLAWSFPSDTEVLTTPALGDIDSDGEVEIVFTSKDGYVRCLSLGGTHDPRKLPWPMLNHDPQLSGNAAGASFETNAVPAPKELPQQLVLERFAPLRLGENTVECAMANLAAWPRRLEMLAEITRPDGTLVSCLCAERVEPFAVKRASFQLLADMDGAYKLELALRDAGTGQTLESLSSSCAFDVGKMERARLQERVQRASKRISQVVDPTLASRMGIAIERAYQGFESALDRTEDLAEQPPEARGQAAARLATAKGKMARTLARIYALDTAAVPPRDFAVLPDTMLRKVFRDEPYLLEPEPTARRARIALAKNEYEGVQFVVVPYWKDLDNFTVTAGPLTHENGETLWPAEDVAVYRIGYVEIGPPEYNWHVEKRGAYPDVLFPAAPHDIPAGLDAQPYAVIVRTRADTPAGRYAGALRFEADGLPPVEAPFEVQVWDFTLPDATTLNTSFWMNEESIRRFYGFEGRTPFDVRKRFYDVHLAHRVSPVKDFPLGGGDMLEDFDYLMAHGQNCFFVNLPGYLEPPERPAFAEKLRATQDLLEQRGWREAGLVYTRDEVAVMARHLIPKVVEMNQWAKTVLPAWPRLQTSAPEQALFDAVDVWCPTIDHFDPVVLEDRMAVGDRLWFYTVWGRPGIMIEFPATDHRLMFWMCWKYGAEGFLYWGTTHWDLNMTSDKRWPEIPWIPYNRQPGHNGCGYLIYPGPEATPLASLRLAAVRDGIEDYEYFALLEQALEQAGGDAPAELRERAETALDVAPEVLVDHETFTEDPHVLLQARAELAELIEALGKAAR